MFDKIIRATGTALALIACAALPFIAYTTLQISNSLEVIAEVSLP